MSNRPCRRPRLSSSRDATGNRRQQTFFCDDDYRVYLGLLAAWCHRCGVEIWAQCLMPNHVHRIAVPSSQDGLRRGIGEAHRRYTRRVNFRERWRGHAWQGRFVSFVLDDFYFLAATRYVEMNPVRAGMVDRPEAYAWSSPSAHLAGRDDVLVKAAPLLDIAGDWSAFLAGPTADGTGQKLQHHQRTGRPLGDEGFTTKLEALLNRALKPGKPGRKPKNLEK